jgi:hypothetical protein
MVLITGLLIIYLLLGVRRDSKPRRWMVDSDKKDRGLRIPIPQQSTSQFPDGNPSIPPGKNLSSHM